MVKTLSTMVKGVKQKHSDFSTLLKWWNNVDHEDTYNFYYFKFLKYLQAQYYCSSNAYLFPTISYGFDSSESNLWTRRLWPCTRRLVRELLPQSAGGHTWERCLFAYTALAAETLGSCKAAMLQGSVIRGSRVQTSIYA